MSAAQNIPSLRKSIGVLEAIADGLAPASVKELSAALRIPTSTCYRIVRTFLQHNWLREDFKGGYRIGFGLARIARSYSGIEHALTLLESPLRELAETTGLSVKITLREGHQAVTALRAEPPNPHSITSPIGSGFPLVIGSAAAALLAQLSDEEIERIIKTAPEDCWERQAPADVWRRVREVRAEGIGRELGQYHASIFAVSTPLRLTEDDLASLTFVGWPNDFAGDHLTTIEKQLKSAAKRFRRILGIKGK
jgi:DNA-binding IclR family transcriptional regulator